MFKGLINRLFSDPTSSNELITNSQLKNWIKLNVVKDKLPGVVVSEDGGIANTKINLKALAKIENLDCSFSNLNSIDELIRHMPNLKILKCNNNSLIELDLSKNINLEDLCFVSC
jgi:Leucine-rich repeat (LRR) protein